MRKLFLIVLTFLIALQFPAHGATLIQDIVLNKDFFIQWDGYDNYALLDIEGLYGGKLIGITLFSPSGVEESFIFEITTKNLVYSKGRIPDKETRELFAATSISIADVKKLCKAAKMREEELHRGWTLYDGKPGANIVIPSDQPQSQFSYNSDIERLRREVQNKKIFIK